MSNLASSSGRKVKGSIKYYAVFHGRQIGIFTNWGKTHPNVDRFPHANFKSYTNLRLAVAHMSAAGIVDPHLYGECPKDISHIQLSKEEYVLNTSRILSVFHSEIEHPLSEPNDTVVRNSQSDCDITFNFQHASSTCIIEDTSLKRVVSSHCLIDTNMSLSETNDNEEYSTTGNQSEHTTTGTSVIFDRETINPSIPKSSTCVNSKLTTTTFPDKSECDTDKDTNLLIQTLQKLLENQQSIINQQEMHQLKLSVELQEIKDKVHSLQTENQKLNETIFDMKICMDQIYTNDRTLHIDLRKITAEKNDLASSNAALAENIAQLKDAESKLQEQLSTKAQEFNLLLKCTEQNDKSQLKPCPEQTTYADKLKAKPKDLQSKVTLPNSDATEVKKTLSLESLDSSFARKVFVQEVSGTHDLDDVQNQIDTERSAPTPSIKQCESLSSLDSTTYFDDKHRKTSQSRLYQNDENVIRRNALKISRQCKNILIGDSNLKHVNRRRLDRSGNTEVRTFRGATVKVLTEIFKRCPVNYPEVEKVSISIGTNNCSRQMVDGEIIVAEMDGMIDVVKQIFPSAAICILSIPPQKKPAVNRYIRKVNKSLKSICENKGVIYKLCSSLWYYVNNDGLVDEGILVDQVHLTEFGLGLLLQNVTYFFFGPPRLRNHYRSNKNDTRPRRQDSTNLIDTEQNESSSYSQLPQSSIETDTEHELHDDYTQTKKHSSQDKKFQHKIDNNDIPKFLIKLRSTCIGLWKRYTD